MKRVLKRVGAALKQPGGLRHLVRSAVLDLRYGGRLLGGAVGTNDPQSGYMMTENTDYEVLNRLFGQIEIRPDDVIVDVGCGKGRMVNWLMSRGHRNRIVGIEIIPEVAEFARARLKRYPQVEIITGDATQLIPPEGTIFYLFNPFSEKLMEAFAERLAERVKAGGARPLVVYFNPLFLGVFERRGGWHIREVEASRVYRSKAVFLQPVQ